MNNISGVAGKVPFIAFPPVSGWEEAPIIAVWHMIDAPRTEAAMAAALPLNDVDAWRVYLRLPVPSEPGDAVFDFFGPTVERAVADFPHALDELHRQIPAGRQPLRLVGCSLGAMVVSCIVADYDDIPFASAALISPAVQLDALVRASERAFGVSYPWTDESRRVAAQLDLVDRTTDIAKREVPMLLVVGDKDDDEFRVSAERMWQALSGTGEAGRYSLITVPGMGHALAEEPGVEPAPQTMHAARVDAIVARWLNRWTTT